MKHILEVWQARFSVQVFSVKLARHAGQAQGTAKKRFLQVCEHLDAIRRDSSQRADIRADIVSLYPHAPRLPSSMEEPKAAAGKTARS